ncbi:hypothetical protein [Clostridium oryzae]|uniref:Bypass of forespore C C-terminal domain-containing protein n=1 Tax=Clostridium oryzae TaxID=1450648 RepID=A0A1V4IUJ9_9CLOT|nr:hypothetical protein [Clostridium oryzae]OPJ63573.1 hypothetical protein CLORY_10810 [Clostridium oryzae]
MKRKRYLYAGLIGTSLVILFLLSFHITEKILTDKNGAVQNAFRENSKRVSIDGVERLVGNNTDILLKLKRGSTFLETKNLKAEEISNKISGKLTLSKIKNYYKTQDYKFMGSEGNKIVFEKNGKYTPGHFYLGANPQGYIAIFKCNSEGDLYIENINSDTSNINIHDLPKKDQEYLRKFAYEYKSKSEAMDELMSMGS